MFEIILPNKSISKFRVWAASVGLIEKRDVFHSETQLKEHLGEKEYFVIPQYFYYMAGSNSGFNGLRVGVSSQGWYFMKEAGYDVSNYKILSVFCKFHTSTWDRVNTMTMRDLIAEINNGE
jgi:hypothetical protein